MECKSCGKKIGNDFQLICDKCAIIHELEEAEEALNEEGSDF